MLDRFDILRGIDRELADTARFIDFHVTHSERQGDLWSVYVDLDRSRRGGLEESLEGSTAFATSVAGPEESNAGSSRRAR